MTLDNSGTQEASVGTCSSSATARWLPPLLVLHCCLHGCMSHLHSSARTDKELFVSSMELRMQETAEVIFELGGKP
jgi:hypothetical protein